MCLSDEKAFKFAIGDQIRHKRMSHMASTVVGITPRGNYLLTKPASYTEFVRDKASIEFYYELCPKKHKKWMNIYENGLNSRLYSSREDADKINTRIDRVACIQVAYEKGQGL